MEYTRYCACDRAACPNWHTTGEGITETYDERVTRRTNDVKPFDPTAPRITWSTNYTEHTYNTIGVA